MYYSEAIIRTTDLLTVLHDKTKMVQRLLTRAQKGLAKENLKDAQALLDDLNFEIGQAVTTVSRTHELCERYEDAVVQLLIHIREKAPQLSVKPTVIYGVFGSGKSKYVAKLITEDGRTFFNGKRDNIEELVNGDDLRAFFHTARSSDVASLQASSLEDAQAKFKRLVGDESIDLSGIEFVAVPAGMGNTNLQPSDEHNEFA